MPNYGIFVEFRFCIRTFGCKVHDRSIEWTYHELGFYAVIDGEKKGAEQLNNEEYEIINDAGIVIEMKDVYRVSKKILKHMNKE